MKKIFITIMIAVAMQSCISSLQPLASPDKITTNDNITGRWMYDGEVYTITPVNQSALAKDLLNKSEDKGASALDSITRSKMYVIEFSSQGVTYNLLAALVKLNGHTFANIYPGTLNDTKRNEDQRDPFIFNKDYLPGFTIAKVEMNGLTDFSLKFIDGDFVRKQLAQGNMKLKHESNSLFGTLMITASTEELQRFVAKYGNDDRIFNNNITFKRPIIL